MVFVVSTSSVVRLTLPLASRLNEPTIDLVPGAVAPEAVKSQFSPENDADLTTLFN
ncbi:hypothetical protein D3C86_2230300 [compost metagenome]